MKRLMYILVLILPAAVLLLSCGGGGGGAGTPATLSSIEVTPTNPSVALGAAYQFKAAGKYSDGSKQDLTSSVAWQSSDETKATVSATGLVTLKTAGSTTIQAASGNVIGETILTVRSPVSASNLPQTGQTVSYAARDDGNLKRGVDSSPNPRFTDNGNGTVTDNLTRLIWLKDANCTFGTTNNSRNWAAALAAANNLANGQCGLTDASTAGQWRLPNVNEFESLLNAGYNEVTCTAPSTLCTSNADWLNKNTNNTNPIQGLFTNVHASMYWTSTTYAPSTSRAWFVDMSVGLVSYPDDKGTSNYYVWPVR